MNLICNLVGSNNMTHLWFVTYFFGLNSDHRFIFFSSSWLLPLFCIIVLILLSIRFLLILSFFFRLLSYFFVSFIFFVISDIAYLVKIAKVLGILCIVVVSSKVQLLEVLNVVPSVQSLSISSRNMKLWKVRVRVNFFIISNSMRF